MTTRYQGSCSCKRVQFEAEVDLAGGNYKCNCSSCAKRRWWGVHAKPDKFRAISGADELVKWRPAKGPGGFCKHCGVVPFVSGDAADWNDGDYVAVNVACLDGLSPAELSALRPVILDGMHDTWQPITEETSYL